MSRVHVALEPVVQAPVDDLLLRIDPRERASLSPRASGKRVADFVAGRIAARSALRALGTSSGFAVVRTREGPHLGRPVVVGEDGAEADVHVSITHAGAWAAAAASRAPVAVDLVVLEPMGEAARREAFVDGEVEGWARFLGLGADDARVCASAFAAKEALLKLERTGFGAALLSTSCAPLPPTTATPPPAGLPADAAPLRVHARIDGRLRCCRGWSARLDGALLLLLEDER